MFRDKLIPYRPENFTIGSKK
uniref:Uncharacterized protein n=1 Tax=Tetranychus urticae TaxID=32264 RepID=T1KZY1_TETUR